ncbi:MAG: magnesium transporter CorA family protein [Chloroflexota bacterium]|nr:magnesium transporter CorA family protein [Chloroflexia bacterium]MDQ3442525.1 magnesium transporter CorA family protein [Chloroflexota bacterium]
MAKIEISFDGDGRFDTVGFDELPKLLQREHAFVWLDVDANEPDELDGLRAQFGLHRVDVEHALDRQQRPKISLYEDMLYLEFYGLRLENGDIQTDDIGVFVGEQFIITVRRDDRPSLEQIRERWREEQNRGNGVTDVKSPPLLGRSTRAKTRQPSAPIMLYAILDDLVDGYFPVVDWLGEAIEDLEEAVTEGNAPKPQLQIQQMRTKLLHLRRLLSPQQEVVNSLLRRDVPVIDEAIIPYFADVYDHLLRIHDWMESYRDHLSTIVDLQLSMQSNRLNKTMRTLTAWSIILMASTLIAGIYGMNFVHMPELAWRFGYPAALLVMASLGVGLYATFRRQGWW